jgi:O-antigen ligase
VRSPRKLLTLGGIVMIGLLLLAYAPDTYFDRMGTIRHYENDGSAMARITAWKASIRMFTDNPLFGVSAGNFPIAIGTKYKPPDVEIMAWMTAHSMYFLVLGELALPGIIALLVLILGGIHAHSLLIRQLRSLAAVAHTDRAKEMRETERMLYLQIASVVGFAIAGAFLSVAYYPHIFVLTALMIAARKVALGAKRSSESVGDASEGVRPGRFHRSVRGRRAGRVVQQSLLDP